MKFVTYLSFDGCCREAFEAYARILNGKIVNIVTHAETPAGAHVPESHRDKIINAHLVAGEGELMGADVPPGMPTRQQAVSVSIQLDDVDNGRRVFEALSEGGEVAMAYQPTFWAKGFGMTRDRFGTNWMVNAGHIRA